MAAAQEDRHVVPGARRHRLHRRRGRVGRAPRLQRLGQVDPAEARLRRPASPTAGRVLTRGRVAGLIEVGAGFHPDLSGRENVYLNAAILGMTQGGDRRALRRDRRVQRDRRVHRHRGQALLLRACSCASRSRSRSTPNSTSSSSTRSSRSAMRRSARSARPRSAELIDAGKTLLVVSHDLDMVSETSATGASCSATASSSSTARCPRPSPASRDPGEQTHGGRRCSRAASAYGSGSAGPSSSFASGKAIVEHTLERLEASPSIDEVVITMNAASIDELDPHARPAIHETLGGAAGRRDAQRLHEARLAALPDSADVLRGRSVVVFGGSHGIGASIARQARAAGARVHAFS